MSPQTEKLRETLTTLMEKQAELKVAKLDLDIFLSGIIFFIVGTIIKNYGDNTMLYLKEGATTTNVSFYISKLGELAQAFSAIPLTASLIDYVLLRIGWAKKDAQKEIALEVEKIIAELDPETKIKLETEVGTIMADIEHRGYL